MGLFVLVSPCSCLRTVSGIGSNSGSETGVAVTTAPGVGFGGPKTWSAALTAGFVMQHGVWRVIVKTCRTDMRVPSYDVLALEIGITTVCHPAPSAAPLAVASADSTSVL